MCKRLYISHGNSLKSLINLILMKICVHVESVIRETFFPKIEALKKFNYFVIKNFLLSRSSSYIFKKTNIPLRVDFTPWK